MAEASIDIRVFPNKEMTSVDFAEMMDTAIFNSGVIQGCETKVENGIFTITSGRIVVGGRLGVVTGGTVPNPTTLTKTEKCYPLAVCDLSNNDNPFYFIIATAADLARLGLDTEDENTTFNTENGIKALIFGICDVNPATGLIIKDTYHKWGQATAKKGWDWYSGLVKQITDLETAVNNKLTWKMSSQTEYKSAIYHEVPSNAKEIYVVVWIRWVSTGSATQKTSLGFHIPINDYLFVSSADLVGHVNHWTKTNNGFVRLRLSKANGKYLVKIYNVYQGDTDVTANTYWNIMYR